MLRPVLVLTARAERGRMHNLRWWAAALALGVLMAAAALLSSCTGVTRSVVAPPEIEGATFVGNKVCAECHKLRERCKAAMTDERGEVEWVCPKCWKEYDYDKYLYEHLADTSGE